MGKCVRWGNYCVSETYTASQSHRLYKTNLIAEFQNVHGDLDGHFGICGALFWIMPNLFFLLTFIFEERMERILTTVLFILFATFHINCLKKLGLHSFCHGFSSSTVIPKSSNTTSFLVVLASKTNAKGHLSWQFDMSAGGVSL